MSQQPEPLSPEERGHLREALTRVMGPLKGILRPAPYSEDLLINPATLIELLAENESLAARVSSLEAERDEAVKQAALLVEWSKQDTERHLATVESAAKAIGAESAKVDALREKAQEVRRAYAAFRNRPWHGEQVVLEAAIDALVPPVPAPPENEKEARS